MSLTYNINNIGFSANHRTRKPSDISKLTAMYHHFVEGLKVDMNRYVYNLDYFDTVTRDFSDTLETLKSWLAEAGKQESTVNSCSNPTPIPPPSPAHDTWQQVDNQPSTEPVFFLPFSVEDNFTVEDICEGLDFRTIGDREVCYFGNIPYEYGHSIRHEPKLYPSPANYVICWNISPKILMIRLLI